MVKILKILQSMMPIFILLDRNVSTEHLNA